MQCSLLYALTAVFLATGTLAQDCDPFDPTTPMCEENPARDCNRIQFCASCQDGMCKRCIAGFQRTSLGLCERCAVANCKRCTQTGRCLKCDDDFTLDAMANLCVLEEDSIGVGSGGGEVASPSGQQCPSTCTNCQYEDDGSCWCMTCGNTYNVLPGDYLKSIAIKCLGKATDIELNALRQANDLPSTFGDTITDNLPYILKMPKIIPCSDPAISACPDGTFWFSFASAKGTVMYGCITPDECEGYFKQCLRENRRSCPNCCFSRLCKNDKTNNDEKWYFGTVPGENGWSMHCDPPPCGSGCRWGR